jgi:hypothetical protein
MEHTSAEFVRLLTPFRFRSLLGPLGVTGETLMSIAELIRTAKAHIVGESPKERQTRSFRAEDTDPDLMEALLAADYSHLPEINRAHK